MPLFVRSMSRWRSNSATVQKMKKSRLTNGRFLDVFEKQHAWPEKALFSGKLIFHTFASMAEFSAT